MKDYLVNLLEAYILYDNAYDDDLEEKERDFLEKYILLENVIREVYSEERPYLFGLKKDDYND